VKLSSKQEAQVSVIELIKHIKEDMTKVNINTRKLLVNSLENILKEINEI